MKRINLWQRFLCLLACPRFRKDMPKDEPGEWVACSIMVSPFGGRKEIDFIKVEGLKNAYEVARWLALKLDWRLHPFFGVQWGVRKADN